VLPSVPVNRGTDLRLIGLFSALTAVSQFYRGSLCAITAYAGARDAPPRPGPAHAP